MSLENRYFPRQSISIGEQGSFRYGNAQANFIDVSSTPSARRAVGRIELLLDILGVPHDPITGKLISHDNDNKFIPVALDGTLFYLNSRTMFDPQVLKEIQHGKKTDITIVSGPCLFDRAAVKVIMKDETELSLAEPRTKITSPIDRLYLEPQLSLYELDSARRLGSMINALVKTTPAITAVNTNIPSIAYYDSLIDAYHQGFATKKQVNQWIDHVDRRHYILFLKMFAQSTQDIPKERSLIFRDLSPLAPLRLYMRASIETESPPQLADAITILCQKSPLWQKMITVEHPTTWQELTYLSYVYAELEPGYTQTNEDKVQIALVVENPTESKIIAHAKRLVNAMSDNDRFNIIALFPHEEQVMQGPGPINR